MRSLTTFAQQFQAWWKTQETYAHNSDLAAEVGTNRVSVRFWLAGRAFPRDKYCDKLHGITGLDCFGPGRTAARAEHERLIPPEVSADRRSKYQGNADVFRKRALTSWRKRRERERQFVSEEELAALRKNPRERKNVCRECGEILRDVGPHLWPRHKMKIAEYKKKWRFLRSRNAVRSQETNKEQSDVMKREWKRKGKRERKRKRDWLREHQPAAVEASLRTNRPGSARLEERLDMQERRLAARPKHWKRGRDGDVVTDAKIAQLRLAGYSVPEIAAALGMTLAPVFYRLRRMGFPGRARVFLHGEPVGWKHYRELCSDFDLTNEKAAKLLGISEDWLRRKLKPRRKAEALSPKLAKRLLKVRAELLAELRRTPAAGPQGGRPRQLPASDKAELPAKYDALRSELKVFRSRLREHREAPRGATWDWLCERFRAGELPTLKLWPQFFAWLARKSYLSTFREASWIPRDLAIHFLADDYGASETVIAYVVSHPQQQESHQNAVPRDDLHQNGAISPLPVKA